ncbi:DUF4136 domain-containing protein [Cupriavidus campinensis]
MGMGTVAALGALGVLGLSGCASTITTEVTAFRQAGWQNDVPRTYAFEHAPQPPQPPQQDGQLERQTYEQWLADALAGVGFEQKPAGQARYLVSMDYGAAPGFVRVAETYYSDPWYGPWGPYWGPYGYRGYGPWGPGYWPPQTVVRDVPVTFSNLRVYFRDAASGKRVYQVTARNTIEGGSLPAVMPYMIRSAFTEFPSESGRPRRVTLEVEKDKK